MARKKHSEQGTETSVDDGPPTSANSAVADTQEDTAESSRRGPGRLLLLLAIAAILALVLSGGLRSKVLDMLFGAEEEFDYSSTTMPAQDAPVGAQAS